PVGVGPVNGCEISKVRLYFAGRPFGPTTNEFQRADTATYNPAGNSGDGKLLPNDLVQVRRYAAGLDPLQAAGGPLNGIQTYSGTLSGGAEGPPNDYPATGRVTVTLSGEPLTVNERSTAL